MPGPCDAAIDRREGMHRDDRPRRRAPRPKEAVDGVVERTIDRGDALGARRRGEAGIAGHRRRFAHRGDGIGRLRIAVEIDDEAGDRGMDERRVEARRQPLRHREGARIPGDVALALRRREAECAVAGWKCVRGVLADEDERCRAERTVDGRDRDLLRRQACLAPRHPVSPILCARPDLNDSSEPPAFSRLGIFDTGFWNRQGRAAKGSTP